ncbi:DUF3298 and DUF4163 domain-containing protein [Zhenhengia yiwuensis]|uniref:DUF3298 and DUF4163 domain-containing protein n=1 Tax=Zhenhengia yiwuensis TaxID=2763666 RepID=UPI001B557B67|nr:DUF3298 domain-containing protein [Zhenhengia yiwuensis]MBP3912183.1 DUF3298 domain-containing protein [Niameybacter sp.]MDY3367952.1 DUF3298 domain-containing protein [Zhenhengia yiwuensis]
MKRYLVLSLMLVISFHSITTYARPLSHSQKISCPSECAKQSQFKIDIQYKDLDNTIKNKDGVVMLVVEGNSPVVTIENNKKATCDINDFYEGKEKAFEKMEKQYVKMAKKDYSARTKESKKYWAGYSLSRIYTTGRVDNKVISFIQNNNEYTGGAHPNATRFAQNFNPCTGTRLTLKDITKDECKAREVIQAYILKAVQKAAYKDYLSEDYEAHIKDILTEDTWYFSDQGLVIISNEYIITPHAVGILEFTIPYNELTFIKPCYLP